MANKATFRSEKEKAKWQALENKVGHSLTRVVQGQASTADLKAVSSTLGQLNKLASNVFDEAVEAAEAAAKEMKAKAEFDLQQGLTAFEVAVNEALARNNPDLIHQLKDIIELEFLQQDEDLKKTLGTQFSDFSRLLPPKDLPTVNDLLAANELLAEELQQQEERNWELKADSLIDRIYHMFTDVIADVRTGVDGVKRMIEDAQNNTVPEAPRLTYRRTKRPDKEYGLTEKAMQLIARREGVDVTELKETSNLVPVSLNSVSTASEVVASPMQGGSDKWDELYERLSGFLDKKEEPEEPREDPQERESKKADTWWKSFLTWTGSKYSNSKRKAKTVGSWLATLGTGLLAFVMNPTLWKTIVDKFKEYVTLDNIMKVANSAWNSITELYDKYVTLENIKDIGKKVWNFITDAGGTFLTWIKDKLFGSDKKTTPEEMARSGHVPANLTPGAQNQLEAIKALEKSTGMSLMNGMTGPTPDGKPLMPVGYNTTPAGSPTLATQGQALVGPTPDGKPLTAPAQQTTDKPTSSTTTVNNSLSPTASITGSRTDKNTSTSMVNNNLNVTPGITTQPTPQGGASTQTNRRNYSTVGNSPVNMSSFGFHSGVDDGLIMMNSGMLG